MLSLNQLQEIMPHAPAQYLDALNSAMDLFQINTCNRMAAFLANVAVESNQLRWMNEIWGPDAAQLRYDPPDELAAKLGNTEKGDGYKYRGAGPIQITGKANFKKYGDKLGLDLVNNPDLARDFSVGLKLATAYWDDHKLNDPADDCLFDKIIVAINGGMNGADQRWAFYRTALKVLDPGLAG